MHEKLQQTTQPTAETHRASLNAVMRHGGVTLQNILWRPIEGGPPSPADCSLPLTLDLLNDNSLGATSRKTLADALPFYVQPIVIYGASLLLAPALEVETINEIILTGNSAGVEPQLHSTRVNRKRQTHSDAGTDKSFDTVLFASGVVVGNKPLIIGAAFLGEADRCDSARVSLRHLLRQLCADQITLTDIIQRCEQLPHLARVLIAADGGQIIWCNQVASIHWEKRASLINYLAQIRSQNDKRAIPQSEQNTCRRLTLVTFLRSEEKSDYKAPFAQKFDLGEETPLPLKRVIATALSEKRSATGDERPEFKTSRRETQQANSLDHSRRATQAEECLTSAEAGTQSDSQLSSNEKQEHFEEARVALEIALRHLPEGGRLKLSPVNNRGEVRLESFDKDGGETIDITLRDKTFPDGDEIL